MVFSFYFFLFKVLVDCTLKYATFTSQTLRIKVSERVLTLPKQARLLETATMFPCSITSSVEKPWDSHCSGEVIDLNDQQVVRTISSVHTLILLHESIHLPTFIASWYLSLQFSDREKFFPIQFGLNNNLDPSPVQLSLLSWVCIRIVEENVIGI